MAEETENFQQMMSKMGKGQIYQAFTDVYSEVIRKQYQY
jgi:hypothetical protein